MTTTFKNLLLQNRGSLGAESLHKSSGKGDLQKLLKRWSYVDVWPFYGEVKFASLCICMGHIHLYGKILRISNDFSSEAAWPMLLQFLGEPPWSRGIKDGRGPLSKMTAMSIYDNNLWKSSSWEPSKPYGLIVAHIIGDGRSTKVGKMMVLRWRLTFLRKGQICFTIHLYGPYTFIWENVEKTYFGRLPLEQFSQDFKWGLLSKGYW